MAPADLKPSSIASRAIKFLEQQARHPCKGDSPSLCLPCQSREVLGYDPRKATSGLAEYICPECDIGHHERCSSAHCECSCP